MSAQLPSRPRTPRSPRSRSSASRAARTGPRASLARFAPWLFGRLPPRTDTNRLTLASPLAAPPADPALEAATFAAGCFWGLQRALSRPPGVVRTEAGYCQGAVERPSYAAVATRRSGHVEAVRVEYDPARVSYADLLAVWWGALDDPADGAGQGADRGPQYRPAVLWHSAAQRAEAAAFMAAAWPRPSGGGLAVALEPAGPWWPAEAAHQHWLDRGGLDPAPEQPYWMGAFID